jgi:hypothetical protein
MSRRKKPRPKRRRVQRPTRQTLVKRLAAKTRSMITDLVLNEFQKDGDLAMVVFVTANDLDDFDVSLMKRDDLPQEALDVLDRDEGGEGVLVIYCLQGRYSLERVKTHHLRVPLPPHDCMKPPSERMQRFMQMAWVVLQKIIIEHLDEHGTLDNQVAFTTHERMLLMSRELFFEMVGDLGGNFSRIGQQVVATQLKAGDICAVFADSHIEETAVCRIHLPQEVLRHSSAWPNCDD